MRRKTDHRIILRIEVDAPTIERLSGVCDKFGMTQVAVSSKLIQWAATQPDMNQAAILKLLPKGISANVVENILKEMAARK